MTELICYIKKVHNGQSTVYKGTIKQLTERFSYILEMGSLKDSTIKISNYRTVGALVKSLNKVSKLDYESASYSISDEYDTCDSIIYV